MYAEGLGVTKDARVAMSWYEKAGAQGNADAQHSIGRLINQGSSNERKRGTYRSERKTSKRKTGIRETRKER